jgi:hypothetical protein
MRQRCGSCIRSFDGVRSNIDQQVLDKNPLDDIRNSTTKREGFEGAGGALMWADWHEQTMSTP